MTPPPGHDDPCGCGHARWDHFDLYGAPSHCFAVGCDCPAFRPGRGRTGFAVYALLFAAVLAFFALLGWTVIGSARGAPVPFPKPGGEVRYTATCRRSVSEDPAWDVEYTLTLCRDGTGTFDRYGKWGPMRWRWLPGGALEVTDGDANEPGRRLTFGPEKLRRVP